MTLITVKKVERRFEIATSTLCLHVSSDLFYRRQGDARRWSIREERLLTVHTLLGVF